MEYRLSLTPRLLAVGLFACVALLLLLFALGFQLGQAMAGKGTPPVAQAYAPAAGPRQAEAAPPAAALPKEKP